MITMFKFVGNPGWTTIVNPVLYNGTVLAVTREGMTYYPGVGTPQVNEYVYYPGSATIIFFNPFFTPTGFGLLYSQLEKISVKFKL